MLAHLLSLHPFLSLPLRPIPKPLLHSNPMSACVHCCSITDTDPNASSSSSSSISSPSQVDDLLFHSSYLKLCLPTFSNLISCKPIKHREQQEEKEDEENVVVVVYDDDDDDVWMGMRAEAEADVRQEPILSSYYFVSILSHPSLERALANHLATKFSDSTLPTEILCDLILDVLTGDEQIMLAVRDDLRAVKERDPACISYVHCFLNFKGFLAIQSHRIAHRLWSNGRKVLALLIQNKVSETFAVDIHPGARIGRGILLDHATGVVIGETAVIGNDVSILHNVTLGGTGKTSGDRHPKIGNGVLIGAGTCVLGNVRIGDGAKVGAGSVVLKEVPERTTAVGNPAKLVGGKENPVKLDKMPSFTMDHISHISNWSHYVI